MRQGMKEWLATQTIMTGGSTDLHDVLPFQELEQPVQEDTYTLGEARWLAKNIGR